MYFDQNRRAIEAEKPTHSFEYEVLADSHIVGAGSWGPYIFRCLQIEPGPQGESRSICIRTEYPEFDLAGLAAQAGDDEIVLIAAEGDGVEDALFYGHAATRLH